MRIPDPKANTTTEAYLAYKAGYLEESELKPVLYEPYLHFDAWLAYWAGLTNDYPNKGPGKNLFYGTDVVNAGITSTWNGSSVSLSGTTTTSYANIIYANSITTTFPAGTYTFSTDNVTNVYSKILRINYDGENHDYSIVKGGSSVTFTAPTDFNIRICFISGLTSGIQISDTFGLQLEVGSTATTYEPYTIIPEMLTDEEALVAYLSGVTNTYPEEIKDPYDVRIVGYLKYLVSARWGRPEYPVNNEEFYLSTMKPPVVTNDTPSADIELDDTAEAPFIDVKMYGDSYQNVYSGKNLLNTPDGTRSSGGVDTIWVNNIGTFSGTTTGTSAILTFNTVLSENLPQGAYTFSIQEALPYRIIVSIQNADTSSYTNVILEPYNTSVRVNIDFNTRLYRVAIAGFTAGTTVSGVLKQPMLEFSSTATDYEPYVGGVPAPNPDYPQDVNMVTGRQVVGVRSKNLIDNNHLEYLATNANADTIILSSLPTGIRWEYTGGGSPWLLFKVMDLRGYEGKTIRMSAKFDDDGTEYRIMTTNEDGTGRNSAAISNTSGETISYTVPNELGERHFLGYRIGAKAQSVSNFTDLIMTIDEEDMDYAPYGADYEINLDGKNLFDKNALSNGWIDVNGSFNTDSSWKHTDYVSIYPSTPYTTSGFVNGSGVNPARCYYDANKVFISAVKHNNTEPVTDISPSNAHYMIECCKTVDINTLQIELGSTATSYAPYRPPIELCKIGDYQDYIYRDEDGDWYVHKAIGEYVFNGTENWTTEPYGTNSWRVPNLISIYDYNADEIELLCDFSKGVAFNNRGGADATKTCVCYTNSAKTLVVRNTTITTAGGMQTNTAGKRLFYKATPTDTQITNSELISQLDALMEGGSYNGKTYIKVTATDPNLPGLLYVEAGKYD